MTDADEYEKAAKEHLRGPFPPGQQGALAKAVAGLGWAVLAHMKREEERNTVVATETDPLEHLQGITDWEDTP